MKKERKSTTEKGFESRRNAYARGYIVVQRDAMEIKQRQRLMADDDVF